jgi:16S rRNA (cytosine1402-N4)-methyltransferase
MIGAARSPLLLTRRADRDDNTTHTRHDSPGRAVVQSPDGRDGKPQLRPFPSTSHRSAPSVLSPVGGLQNRSAHTSRRCTVRAQGPCGGRPAGPWAHRPHRRVPRLEEPESFVTEQFEHRPVMLGEVVSLFEPVPDGVLIDATVGAGGHSEALLDAHRGLRLLGFDRDPDAVTAAVARLGRFGDRVEVRHASFDTITGAEVGPEPVTAVLFDLGVSSAQLDWPQRGFSYRHDGPLDMRMDPSAPLTAAIVVNTYDAAQLTRILRRNADERFASRIAAAIVAHRPLVSTAQLAEVVRDAIPAATRRRGPHPATRSFQALRMEVNDELPTLDRALDAAIDVLAPGGRLAVLSYHSGEDRVVKDRLRRAERGSATLQPPGLPPSPEARPTLRLVWRGGHTPSAAEVEANPRAASARLRAAERLAEEAR